MIGIATQYSFKVCEYKRNFCNRSSEQNSTEKTHSIMATLCSSNNQTCRPSTKNSRSLPTCKVLSHNVNTIFFWRTTFVFWQIFSGGKNHTICLLKIAAEKEQFLLCKYRQLVGRVA
jgi:hypothetical protein